MTDVPPEVIEAADQATALVQQQALRQLGRLADKATDKAVAVGAQVLGWLQQKLTGVPQAVLAEVERQPEDETHLETLRLQLRKLLAEDEQLREELCRLLPPGGTTMIRQDMTVRGNGTISIQAGRDVRVKK